MDDNFRNSYLTISATWADSPYEGLFAEPETVESRPVMTYIVPHFSLEATRFAPPTLGFPLLSWFFLRSKDACWHHGSFIFVDESCSSNAWKARLAHACLRSIRRHRFPWRKGSASTSTRWTWTHLHLSLSTLYERVVKVAASGGHGIVITSARLCIWQAACYIWVSQPFSANDGMIFGWMIVDAYISPQPVLGLGTKFPPWRHIWPYGQFVTEGGIPGFKGKLSTHLYPQLLIHWNECLQFVLVIYWQE